MFYKGPGVAGIPQNKVRTYKNIGLDTKQAFVGQKMAKLHQKEGYVSFQVLVYHKGANYWPLNEPQ